MKSSACAVRAAARTSSSLASGMPKRMFSAMDVLKRNGSWLTMPMCRRRSASCRSRTSWPSMRTVPPPVS